jgi:hypothetical protein
MTKVVREVLGVNSYHLQARKDGHQVEQAAGDDMKSVQALYTLGAMHHVAPKVQIHAKAQQCNRYQ